MSWNGLKNKISTRITDKIIIDFNQYHFHRYRLASDLIFESPIIIRKLSRTTPQDLKVLKKKNDENEFEEV